MKFSYNFLQEYVDKKLPEPNKLAELLTFHAFEVENVTKEGSDYILNIDILPNRAHDATGHIGIAREIVAILRQGFAGSVSSKASLKLKKHKAYKVDKKKIKGLDVIVQNTTLCPRYMAARIDGVKVGPSPAWLKKRLAGLGVNSINNIVDAVNYAMLATAQPLHAFDYNKLKGEKIVVRAAKKGETIQSLDDVAYILDNSMLVIADETDSLAIAGIKGGKVAEIEKNTTNIVIESANFGQTNIRRTSDALALQTDASWRFEHEMPLSLTEAGLLYVVDLIHELAGGKVVPEIIDTLARPIPKRILSIRSDYTNQLLGIQLSDKNIGDILKNLDFIVKSKKGGFQVEVPSFRLDIEREEDLVEEVGRIIGYEEIPLLMPSTQLGSLKRNVEKYWDRAIHSRLASGGFNEVHNISFVSDNVITEWGFDKKRLWGLEKPISEELKYLRPSLLPVMTKVVGENLRFFEEVRIFEVAEVFDVKLKDREEARLALSIGSRNKGEQYFYELKGVVEGLINSLGMSDVWFDDAFTAGEEKGFSFLHAYRRAQVKVGNRTLGFIGEVAAEVAKKNSIKGSVFVAEFSMSALLDEAEKEQIYQPISTYPQSIRDISISVPRMAKIGDVVRIINDGAGALLRDVDLFDYYDAEAQEDLKSIAFHLIFQAEDRTLTSKEVDDLMKLISTAVEAVGWQIK